MALRSMSDSSMCPRHGAAIRDFTFGAELLFLCSYINCNILWPHRACAETLCYDFFETPHRFGVSLSNNTLNYIAVATAGRMDTNLPTQMCGYVEIVGPYRLPMFSFSGGTAIAIWQRCPCSEFPQISWAWFVDTSNLVSIERVNWWHSLSYDEHSTLQACVCLIMCGKLVGFDVCFGLRLFV